MLEGNSPITIPKIDEVKVQFIKLGAGSASHPMMYFFFKTEEDRLLFLSKEGTFNVNGTIYKIDKTYVTGKTFSLVMAITDMLSSGEENVSKETINQNKKYQDLLNYFESKYGSVFNFKESVNIEELDLSKRKPAIENLLSTNKRAAQFKRRWEALKKTARLSNNSLLAKIFYHPTQFPFTMSLMLGLTAAIVVTQPLSLIIGTTAFIAISLRNILYRYKMAIFDMSMSKEVLKGQDVAKYFTQNEKDLDCYLDGIQASNSYLTYAKDIFKLKHWCNSVVYGAGLIKGNDLPEIVAEEERQLKGLKA